MKRNNSIFGLFFLVLLAVFSLEACSGGGGGTLGGGGGGNGNPPGGSNSIAATGSVKSGGAGVPGASVRAADMLNIYSQSASTDAGGNYSMSLRCDDPNGCTMNVTATSGGKTGTIQVLIKKSVPTQTFPVINLN